MNSLFADEPAIPAPYRRLDIALLHRMECKLCPLSSLPNNKHPNMPASGAEHPLIYIIGEAPGRNEDEEGMQFVGESGRLLRSNLPKHLHITLRFNNVVRTRPPGNRTPSPQEVECCRPSIIRDIERSKPQVIWGFGNVPLNWISGFTGITLWRGRRMPVRIGTHTCWYYPMIHPAALLRRRHTEDGDVSSEDERMFRFDIKRAAADLEAGLETPWVPTPSEIWANLENVMDIRGVEKALTWAAKQPCVGVDYETNVLRPYSKSALVLTAAVANGDRGFAFPIDHPDARWTAREHQSVRELWTRFLKSAPCIKYVHNLAFELEWTGVQFGQELIRAGHWEDTATQAAILDERRGKQKPGCFSLEFLVQQHFGFNLKKLTNIDRKNMIDVPLDVTLTYNAGDARYHCLLGLKQKQLIEKAELLPEAYQLALRRVPAVVLTQMKGIPIDQSVVKQLHAKYSERLSQAEKALMSLPIIKEYENERGRKFKPLSNPDVLYVLRDMLKRRECHVEDKFTKEMRWSADKTILAKIDHPFARKLVELREPNKRLGTYITPYLPPNSPLRTVDDPPSVLHPDGLIHPVLNTYFAETGRLSSEEPNAQNIPKREDEAREVRKQFHALPGYSVLAFDYGQIEARIIAMFSKDKAFIKALWENYDVHMEWAQRIAQSYPTRIGGRKNLTDKKVMKDFRNDIKNEWTFPLFFGAKLESAAGYLNIPVNELKPHYKEFWKTFSAVKDWQEEVLAFYYERGYVENMVGRRRRGPLSLNQVINTPIQSTAAEIIMTSMCRLSELGVPELQPEINIHDDLTFFRIPNDRLDELAERIIDIMLDVPYPWAKIVPITVEMSVGENWLELEEVATFSSANWYDKDERKL